jgi:hypothetical protein
MTACTRRHDRSETGVPKDEALSEYGEGCRFYSSAVADENGSSFEWRRRNRWNSPIIYQLYLLRNVPLPYFHHLTVRAAGRYGIYTSVINLIRRSLSPDRQADIQSTRNAGLRRTW